MAEATSPDEGRSRWFTFRAARIRWPEWVAGLGSLVLLYSLVGLSWSTHLRASGGQGPKVYVSNSEDGWHALSHAHWLILLTVLVGLALLLLQGTRRAPALPVAFSFFVIVLGALSTVWLIVRVPIDPSGGRELGGWLALISAAILAGAGYASFRMEGIAPEDGPQEIPTITARDLASRREPGASERS